MFLINMTPLITAYWVVDSHKALQSSVAFEIVLMKIREKITEVEPDVFFEVSGYCIDPGERFQTWVQFLGWVSLIQIVER